MQTKRPAIWRMCGGCGAASGRQSDAELARAHLRMTAVLQRAVGDRDDRPLNATKPHAKLRRIHSGAGTYSEKGPSRTVRVTVSSPLEICDGRQPTTPIRCTANCSFELLGPWSSNHRKVAAQVDHNHTFSEA